MILPQYKAQVELLLDVLPYVAKEQCFALKGGTAINIFLWEMPRLSVDIDLTYVHFDDRNIALIKISESLQNIKEDICSNIAGIKVEATGIMPGKYDKLLCIKNGVKIKIEVNTTMRGVIKPYTLKQTSEAVRSSFGSRFAAIQVISDAEIFGGKICAALDRQHPRDLFDINQLFENGGISKEIKEGFIAALLSHNRPIHEMFKPNFQNQQEAFLRQFEGMALRPFSYTDFENTRMQLVKEVNNMLTENDKQFLLSFKSGDPDWSLTDIDKLQDLPAVQWKQKNIQDLMKQNPNRHIHLVKCLENALY